MTSGAASATLNSQLSMSLAAVTAFPRIKKISLSDYRAFPSSQSCELDLGDTGKNLLLYGENGSGKTSLFRALRDLFDPAGAGYVYADYRNIFTKGDQGYVSVELNSGSPSEFRWDYGGDHPAKTAGDPFQLFASRCLFLDYRDLLETNFVHRKVTPNLFPLLVEHVLKRLLITVDGKQFALGELNKSMCSAKPTRHYASNLRWVDKRCADLTQALSNHLPEVVNEALRLLALLGGDDAVFDLKPHTITYDRSIRDFANRQIDYTANYCGELISHPQLFLNEARLTSLAIALYLAAARIIFSGRSGLLVLDDVLIGLDISHRLPLLRLFGGQDFRDWQIILLTHDRVWFDLAQLETAQSGEWASYELQSKRVQSINSSGAEVVHEVPLVMPPFGTDIFKHYLQKAKDALNAPRDERLAGLYARVAFEAKLKSYCNNKSVQVTYKLASGELKTKDFLDAIERRLKWEGTYVKAYAHIERVKLFRDGVLNPLSHCHPVTLDPGEIESAIDAVDRLNFDKGSIDCLHEAVKLLSSGPTSDSLRESAVCLRTSFELDIRDFLLRHNGKVKYRHNWSNLTLVDIWDAAKLVMSSLNSALATPIITDIEAHAVVFLDAWNYYAVSRLSEAELNAAMSAFRGASTANVQSRIATFV